MNDQRHRDLPRTPQYVHYTPLNAPRARVMEEALRADLLTLTQSPTPKGADGRKHCQYHQNLGHTTEDCITLKDKLESLIQAGHLRGYVQGKRPSPIGCFGRPSKRSNHFKRDDRQKKDRRSRSRSREQPLRGVINTISGGFAGGGPSTSTRKRHLRSLHSVNPVEMVRRSMPSITFSNEDFHAPDPNQNDPMVITAVISRYNVGKVLVDQGSSTNILYWKNFQQMDISEDMIMLFHEQILGFAGERVDTRGYVDLRMCLGTKKDAKELKIRFLLVEANTSYNVLLGCPCLNAFGAIVSTPHLTLKYPSDSGKIWVVRADQKVARECYVAGLRIKPWISTKKVKRSEVAMVELDPRVNTEDRMEPLGKVQPFILGTTEEQNTTIGRSLTEAQSRAIG
ncbi:uncharacterized protein LOC128193934 [Vigna angularis]|uniref:uncharacterized protein LOC128193934 n=1 Tax=Phaseolus angularis TaxID=3914 RepID=UPI0022B2E13B|nr:uncharacterized protein LOC128193934 [Vigna angularis]